MDQKVLVKEECSSVPADLMSKGPAPAVLDLLGKASEQVPLNNSGNTDVSRSLGKAEAKTLSSPSSFTSVIIRPKRKHNAKTWIPKPVCCRSASFLASERQYIPDKIRSVNKRFVFKQNSRPSTSVYVNRVPDGKLCRFTGLPSTSTDSAAIRRGSEGKSLVEQGAVFSVKNNGKSSNQKQSSSSKDERTLKCEASRSRKKDRKNDDKNFRFSSKKYVTSQSGTSHQRGKYCSLGAPRTLSKTSTTVGDPQCRRDDQVLRHADVSERNQTFNKSSEDASCVAIRDEETVRQQSYRQYGDSSCNTGTYDKRPLEVNVKGVLGGTVDTAIVTGVAYGNVGTKYVNQNFQPGAIKQYLITTDNVMLSDTAMPRMQDCTPEMLEQVCTPFVETTGYIEARSRLESCGQVTLIGEAGSGKTTIGYRLLKYYNDLKTFSPIIVDDVDELKHFRDPKEPTLVFVDDVFGRSAYTTTRLQTLLLVFKQLERTLRLDKFRIIFSSRNYIFREALPDVVLFKESLFSETSQIDLSGDAVLLQSEKEKILRVFAERTGVTITDEDVKTIVEMKTTYGFPHACHLFSQMKRWHTRPVQFFRKPIPVLIESVKHLSRFDKNKFAVLLLVILNDGKFNLAKLRKESDVPDVIHGYASVKEFVSHRHEIASPLIGSYLTSTRDTLSFRHPTVEDTVAYVIGKMDPLFLTVHCSMRVVYERVRIHISEGDGSTQPTQGDTQWFHIVLSDDYHDDLISRFLSEMENDNFALVCIHQACSDKKFVMKLFEEDKRGQTITENTFHKADGKYRQTFLQWSVMNHSEALCEKVLKETTFSILEKNSAIMTSCVTGNWKALRLLIESLSPLGKQMLTKMKVRKLDIVMIQDTEEISVQKGPDNRYSLLHVACNYGYRDVVDVLIKSGFPVNNDEDYESPLHVCCRKGHVNALYVLFEHGADLEAKHSYWEETPLHVCARLGHLTAVKKLVEERAKIEAKDIDGKTPLLNACEVGNESIAEFLIEHGADKEMKDCTGSTPLVKACIHGHYRVVQSLVAHNAHIEVNDYNGKTPLMTACEHGHENIGEFLIQRGASTEDPDGRLLHSACQGGCLNIAKQLISNSHQCQQIFKCISKVGLLHSVSMAAGDKRETCKLALADLLIGHGADMNAVDENNITPLLVAAESGYERIVCLLLEKDAIMNVIGNDGQTVFHKAAKGDLVSLILSLTLVNSSFIGSKMEVQTLVNRKDDNNDTPLHIAAMFGNSDTVRDLLVHTGDINAINREQQSPLHLAAQRQDVDVIQSLLDHGADVHLKDKTMKTPLHIASMHGNVDTVQLFLDKKADINAVDYKHRSALHKALQCRKNEIALLLLSSGADINIEDNRKHMPLHLAAECGNTETLEKLLKMKTDINATDVCNQTPLHLATGRPTADNVQILVKCGADVNAVDADGMQPLHHAAMMGRADTVQLLLDNKAEVNACTRKQETSLHLAAKEEGALYTAYVLLENNTDVNAVNGAGQTPLHVAVSRCCAIDTVRLLLDMDANVGATDDKCQTPLHAAANNGDADIIQLLLKNRADLNARNNQKQTPLHIAVIREPDTFRELLEKDARFSTTGVGTKKAMQFVHDIVHMILDNKADVNVLDANHQTPLHNAILKSRIEIVSLLLRFSADVNITDNKQRTPLHLAVISERLDIVRMMTNLNIDINATDFNNETPLHLAATRRIPSISRHLLKCGANVNAPNSDKKTPLHLAAAGSSAQIQPLLDSGADINEKDKDGFTPIHVAAMCRLSDPMNILLCSEVDVNATNTNQQTALHLAAGKGYADKVEMLLDNMAEVNVMDDMKRTPLHMAAKGNSESLRFMVDTLNMNREKDTVGRMVKMAKAHRFKHAETCRILLKHKANVNAQDIEKRTPLHFAVESEHSDIIQVLCDNGADVDVVDSSMKTPLKLAQNRQKVDIVNILLGNVLQSTYSRPIFALPP